MSTRRTGHERILGWLMVVGLSAAPAAADVVTDWNLITQQVVAHGRGHSTNAVGQSGFCDGAHRHARRHPGVPAAVRAVQHRDHRRVWLSYRRGRQGGARRAGQPLSGTGGVDQHDLSELPDREWTAADESGRGGRATSRREHHRQTRHRWQLSVGSRDIHRRPRAGRMATDTAGVRADVCAVVWRRRAVCAQGLRPRLLPEPAASASVERRVCEGLQRGQGTWRRVSTAHALPSRPTLRCSTRTTLATS